MSYSSNETCHSFSYALFCDLHTIRHEFDYPNIKSTFSITHNLMMILTWFAYQYIMTAEYVDKVQLLPTLYRLGQIVHGPH